MRNAKKKATAIVLTAGVLFTSGMVLADTDMGQQLKDWVASGITAREQVIKEGYKDDAVIETAKLTGEAEKSKQEVAGKIDTKATEKKQEVIRTLSDLVERYKSQLTTATSEELANMNATFNKIIDDNQLSIDEVVKILGEGNKALADQQLDSKQGELMGEVESTIDQHKDVVSQELQGTIDTSKSNLLISMNEEQETAQTAINQYLVDEFEKAVTDVKEHIASKEEIAKQEIENIANTKQEEVVGDIDQLIQNAFAVGDN
ncbi:hypothetical protein PBV87_05060 [Niameybacter massiliensis]|uniref:Uncharacterized protein n=1 Tax=Holtiella tumoricola TaxID=3018743 RepID=A0AA42DKZ0_9FIRM|nr:hypothetical protein [Holtiella tumoricola]MDA3730868.1 hypothetical protein [Holtiella tumoricola]